MMTAVGALSSRPKLLRAVDLWRRLGREEGLLRQLWPILDPYLCLGVKISGCALLSLARTIHLHSFRLTVAVYVEVQAGPIVAIVAASAVVTIDAIILVPVRVWRIR